MDLTLTTPPLVLRRENSLKRDDEVQNEVWRHVLMRLTSTRRKYRRRIHGAVGGRRVGSGLRPEVTSGWSYARRTRVGVRHVIVSRQLADIQRVRCLAAELSEGYPVADMNWASSLEVRQSKVYSPVAAVRRSQNGEKRLVLIDRQ